MHNLKLPFLNMALLSGVHCNCILSGVEQFYADHVFHCNAPWSALSRFCINKPLDGAACILIDLDPSFRSHFTRAFY